jgi:hypothetical protein
MQPDRSIPCRRATSRWPIRVRVCDDQALVRSGFRMILEARPDLEVVGEAEDGEGCIYSDRWPHQRFSPSRLVGQRGPWGPGVAGNHQEVTQAGRLEVPGQGRIESGIVQGQAHQQPGLAWREQSGDGPTHERSERLGRPHERVGRRAEPAETSSRGLRGDGPAVKGF